MAKAKKSRKPAGKKAARRAPARKGSPAVKAKKKSPAAKAKKSPAAKKAAAPSLEELARKIVRLTQVPQFGPAQIRELYNPDATSVEASGQTARGYAGLDEKMRGWDQMQTSTVSKPRNVWTGPSSICIEWDLAVSMRDGRKVNLREIAVHEIKNGKIQTERYYYNPTELAPPAPSGGGPPGA
jgi:ketosteroid isomerase-like protein